MSFPFLPLLPPPYRSGLSLSVIFLGLPESGLGTFTSALMVFKTLCITAV